MAMANRRLLNEAIATLRTGEDDAEPTTYVEEASIASRELASGFVKRRMTGTPNVMANVTVAMQRLCG